MLKNEAPLSMKRRPKSCIVHHLDYFHHFGRLNLRLACASNAGAVDTVLVDSVRAIVDSFMHITIAIRDLNSERKV
jgi:hypothetical protein